MYSFVMMMAMTNPGATPDAVAPDQARYGNHLQSEQYRHNRGGCCGGGGGRHGGYGGCSGGGGYGGCSGGYGYGGGYGGCYGGGYGGGYGGCTGGYGGYGYGGHTAHYGYAMPSNGNYYGGNMMPYDGSSYGWGQMPNSGNFANNTTGYQSFYSGSTGDAGGASARLMVHLPAGARLTIDGTPTQQMDSVREFVSPPLQADRNFTYTLRADINGRTVT